MSTLKKRQLAVNPGPEPEPRSAAGDALSALVVQVFRLNGRLLAVGDELAGIAGQSSARWFVLAAVERAPASVAQIAHRLNLARQSVQRVADLLVQEKLASYEDNPHHRRAKLLQLTLTGRTALRKIQAAQRPWADSLGAKIGEVELRQAHDILGRVLESLT